MTPYPSLASMRKLSVLLVLLLAGLAAPPADAAGGAVFVTPTSPAGVEYALPQQSARREAAGGDAAATGSPKETAGLPTRAAPLFGVGIRPARAAHVSAGTSTRQRPRRAGQHPTALPSGATAAPAGGTTGGAMLPVDAAGAAGVVTARASSGLGWWAVGAPLAIVVVAAATGLTVRRRVRRRPS